MSHVFNDTLSDTLNKIKCVTVNLKKTSAKMDKKRGVGERLKGLRQSKDLRQVDAAELIGIGYSSLQGHESGKIPSRSTIKKYADFYKCDETWLLTGLGKYENAEPEPFFVKEDNASPYNSKEYLRVVEVEHIDIVKRFANKERAKLINEALLEIEKISPEAFNDIEAYIKGMARGLKLTSGNTALKQTDQRQCLRRSECNKEAVPNEGDRRTATDRRTANGE